jgi:hypothetical protein
LSLVELGTLAADVPEQASESTARTMTPARKCRIRAMVVM